MTTCNKVPCQTWRKNTMPCSDNYKTCWHKPLRKRMKISSTTRNTLAWSIKLSLILTHLDYIANGKKSCYNLQQFTGRKCVTLFSAVLWRHPSHRPCLLDVRRCNVVLRNINVRNTCKRLRYSQNIGGIASRSWFDLLYNWPPNSELLLNNSLLELIYFLINKKKKKSHSKL